MAERLGRRVARLQRFLEDQEKGLMERMPVGDLKTKGSVEPYNHRLMQIATARDVIEWIVSGQKEVDEKIIRKRHLKGTS